MNRRKRLGIGLAVAFLCAITWLGFRTVSKLNTQKETTARRQRPDGIPAFTAHRAERLLLTGPSPTVVVYFNPDCEHCQYQAGQLARHPALLRKTRVWLLSTEPLPALQTFARRYRLDSLPAVTVARIEPRVAFDSLGFRAVPHLLVYGPDGRLKKEFRGETRWEAVEKAL